MHVKWGGAKVPECIGMHFTLTRALFHLTLLYLSSSKFFLVLTSTMPRSAWGDGSGAPGSEKGRCSRLPKGCS
eukprot:scaffold22822_cov53-Phaeocystis_antarctica.AAC.2